MDSYRQKIRRLNLAVNRIDGIYYQLSKILGEKDNLICLLYALDDGKPHSQKQICEEWLISRTTLNTIVKECIEKGYLTLQANAHSKEKQILLTESGRQYASKLLGFLYRAEEAAIKETLDRHGDAFITALEDFADSFLEKVQ